MKNQPYSTKRVLAEKERDMAYASHMAKVSRVYERDSSIRELIDSDWSQMENKQLMHEQNQRRRINEQNSRISSENRRLLSNLLSISEKDRLSHSKLMSPDKLSSNQSVQYSASSSMFGNRSVIPSRARQKQEENTKIQNDNFQLAYRMVHLPSLYPKRDFDSQYKEHKKQVRMRSKFLPDPNHHPFPQTYNTPQANAASTRSQRSRTLNSPTKSTSSFTIHHQNPSENTQFSETYDPYYEHAGGNRSHKYHSFSEQKKELILPNLQQLAPLFSSEDKFYGEPLKEFSSPSIYFSNQWKVDKGDNNYNNIISNYNNNNSNGIYPSYSEQKTQHELLSKKAIGDRSLSMSPTSNMNQHALSLPPLLQQSFGNNGITSGYQLTMKIILPPIDKSLVRYSDKCFVIFEESRKQEYSIESSQQKSQSFIFSDISSLEFSYSFKGLNNYVDYSDLNAVEQEYSHAHSTDIICTMFKESSKQQQQQQQQQQQAASVLGGFVITLDLQREDLHEIESELRSANEKILGEIRVLVQVSKIVPSIQATHNLGEYYSIPFSNKTKNNSINQTNLTEGAFRSNSRQTSGEYQQPKSKAQLREIQSQGNSLVYKDINQINPEVAYQSSKHERIQMIKALATSEITELSQNIEDMKEKAKSDQISSQEQQVKFEQIHTWQARLRQLQADLSELQQTEPNSLQATIQRQHVQNQATIPKRP